MEFFWNRTNNPLLMAVIAGCVYSKLAQFYKGTVSRGRQGLLPKLKSKFVDRANKLVEIGYVSDPIKVMSLLEKRNHRWGDKNLMELSHIGHLRAFIASEYHYQEIFFWTLKKVCKRPFLLGAAVQK